MTQEPYSIPEEWQNYGDANPERHGGLFVKWERDMWHFITTRHFADLPKGMVDNEHMFDHGWFEPMDIWKKGELSNGFTDWTIDQLNSYSNSPFQIIESQEELPENETIEDYMLAILENDGEWLVSSIAYAFSGYYGGDRTDFSEDYWGYLEGFGIEKENF